MDTIEDKIPEGTSKLLDDEVVTEAKRRERLGQIAQEIELIVLKDDLTMGELTEVMDLFNARAQVVFSKTKINVIKQAYDRNP